MTIAVAAALGVVGALAAHRRRREAHHRWYERRWFTR